jgi:elongation factor 1-beta
MFLLRTLGARKGGDAVPVSELRRDDDRPVLPVPGPERALSLHEVRIRGTVGGTVGQVAVLFRLMPQGVETDLNEVAKSVRGALPTGVTIRGMQVKDIAFGLKSLLVSVVMADTGGVLDSTERAFAKLPHVESVEVMEEGLL